MKLFLYVLLSDAKIIVLRQFRNSMSNIEYSNRNAYCVEQTFSDGDC